MRHPGGRRGSRPDPPPRLTGPTLTSRATPTSPATLTRRALPRDPAASTHPAPKSQPGDTPAKRLHRLPPTRNLRQSRTQPRHRRPGRRPDPARSPHSSARLRQPPLVHWSRRGAPHLPPGWPLQRPVPQPPGTVPHQARPAQRRPAGRATPRPAPPHPPPRRAAPSLQRRHERPDPARWARARQAIRSVPPPAQPRRPRARTRLQSSGHRTDLAWPCRCSTLQSR